MDEELQAYNDQLKKSNVLINAKFNVTALQMKEINLALYHIQQGKFKKKKDGFYVEMTTKELKKETKGSETYIYKELQRATSDIMNVKIGVLGEKKFKMVTLINMAEYENGVLNLRFPLEIEPYIDVNSDFTLIPKNSSLHLKKIWSIRLYEILKSECYYPKYYKGVKNGIFKKTISIDELRVILCLIDLEDNNVKEAMEKACNLSENGKGIDYSKVVEAAKNVKYKDWRHLNMRVIAPAIKEINETPETGITVKYKPIKVGRSYKKIEFIITDNEINNEYVEEPNVIDVEYVDVPKARKKTKKEKEIEVQNNFETMLQVAALIGPVGLDPVADIDMVCKVARYDVEKIKKAAEYMKTQKNIDNPPAYMRKCIEEEWYDNIPVPKKETKKKTNNRFNDFPQREYSSEEFAEMEKKLWRQQRAEMETEKKTNNRFNNFPQREYSSEEIAEIEKKLLRQSREEGRKQKRTNEDDDIPKWSAEPEDKREE